MKNWYNITYYLKYGIVRQKKHLISQENYVNDINPRKSRLYEIEKIQEDIGSSVRKEITKALKENDPGKTYSLKISDGIKIELEKISIKKYLDETYGEYWFTTNSPLGKSIETGILDLGRYGNCKIEVAKI